MFGAPYDFRVQPLYLGEFWTKLKTLIEEAYSLQGNQSVVLYGHSSGCFNMHRFLRKKVTEEWKRKYIHSAIFSAPSFGGILQAVEMAWYHWYDPIPDSKKKWSAKAERLFNSTPVIFAHFPNWHVFDKNPILITPEGKPVTARELHSFMNAHQRLSYEGDQLTAASHELYDDPLDDVGVDSYIIFNSAYDTVNRLIFDKGYGEVPSHGQAPGDQTVCASTVEYMCNRWKGSSNRTVVCHDLKSSDGFSHQNMIINPKFIELVYNVAVNDSWKVGGSRFLKGLDDIDGDRWKNLKRRGTTGALE
jgi:hypothetical protein